MPEQEFDTQDEAGDHQEDEHYSMNEDIEDHGSINSDPGLKRIWWPQHIGLDVGILQKEGFSNDSSTSSGSRIGLLNPSLCAFCRVFFDTWDEVTKVFTADSKLHYLKTIHFDKLESLTESSRRGCQLCKYFASLIDLDKLFDPPSSSQLRGIMCLEENTRNGWGFEKDHWLLTLFVFNPDTEIKFQTVRYGILLLPTEVESDIILDEIPLRPEQMDLARQEDSLVAARGWLEECSKSHYCHHPDHQNSRPTRLIKINNNKIRLCIAQEEEDSASYATLSHCWGETSIIRLLRHNLESFMKDIPEAALSKTFRDSIEVARRLGFYYIWIDSLCIVQDDPADWEYESSLMAGVYGSSGLNIAATASPDGAKGCLFDRDITYRQGGTLDVDVGGIRKSYTFCDENLFLRNLEEKRSAPLLNRAWVLQERLLAPRTLHFAVSQLFWECEAKFACETFPGQIPQAVQLVTNSPQASFGSTGMS